MLSNRETFWQMNSYAVVGNTAKKNFPILTYKGLKNRGKKVYPVDASIEKIEKEKTFGRP